MLKCVHCVMHVIMRPHIEHWTKYFTFLQVLLFQECTLAICHHILDIIIFVRWKTTLVLWFPIHLNVVFHLYYNSRAKFLRVIGEIVNFTLLLNQREIYIIIRWYYYRSLRKTRRLLSRKGYSVVIGQASYQNYKLNRYGTPLYYYIIHVLNSAVFNRLRCVFPAFCGYSHTQLWCRRFDCGCNIIAISPITRRPGIALPRLY